MWVKRSMEKLHVQHIEVLLWIRQAVLMGSSGQATPCRFGVAACLVALAPKRISPYCARRAELVVIVPHDLRPSAQPRATQSCDAVVDLNYIIHRYKESSVLGAIEGNAQSLEWMLGGSRDRTGRAIEDLAYKGESGEVSMGRPLNCGRLWKIMEGVRFQIPRVWKGRKST